MNPCTRAALSAALLLTLVGASTVHAADPLPAALPAEHAVRWNPADGGPQTAADTLARLGVSTNDKQDFEIRYASVTPASGSPAGAKVIVRERHRIGSKERYELTYKIRGAEPLPAQPTLKDDACPVGKDPKPKYEADISFVGQSENVTAYSRSCEFESETAAPVIPAALQAVRSTCPPSRMTRWKKDKLVAVEVWSLPGGRTLIEVSRPGVQTAASAKAFEDQVLKPLLQSPAIKPLKVSMTELASRCETVVPAAMAAPVATPTTPPAPDSVASCAGSALAGVGGVAKAWQLSGGGIAAFAKMNINIDGYARAYHPQNAQAGALIHLCNAGRVVLPDGTQYEGSQSNATCTGKFMSDVARIGQAGWQDASVGAVQWYGIVGQGSATIGGRKVASVVPVLSKDGSGFYVSPTSLMDKSVADPADQARYVNPLRIASAVVPKSLMDRGIAMGSFGVAMNVKKRIAVPFVVGDAGPRIGEGSLALARLAAGLSLTDNITRQDRFVGQVDERDVLWVFFGGSAARYDSQNESALNTEAKAAFARWGGEARLARCVGVVPRN